MCKPKEFDLVNRDEYNKYNTDLAFHALRLPIKDTPRSPWYNFTSTRSFTLEPGNIILVPSGIKACTKDDEVLVCTPICSARLEREVQFVNESPVKYTHNSKEQHIVFELVNNGEEPWNVKVGDVIVQGIFLPRV